MRTDDNNNPAAFTTDIASQAGLILGSDYERGTQFPNGEQLWTAKLLGDPIQLTIRVIDSIGYYTKRGIPRWTYIALPKFVWDSLDSDGKRDIVGFHYMNEGGTTMRSLFPNYGQH